MTHDLDDFAFLTELIRQIDAAPDSDVNGRDVAASLGNPDADIEPNVRRLKNRGLIDWAPGPKRLGDGWSTTALAVTQDGYRHDGTGLTR
jgi:predicted transcriptional regulator